GWGSCWGAWGVWSPCSSCAGRGVDAWCDAGDAGCAGGKRVRAGCAVRTQGAALREDQEGAPVAGETEGGNQGQETENGGGPAQRSLGAAANRGGGPPGQSRAARDDGGASVAGPGGTPGIPAGDHHHAGGPSRRASQERPAPGPGTEREGRL